MMADRAHTEERRLREQLQALHKSYQREAQPIIDRLVAIESMKPIAPIHITAEQAAALGLLTTSPQNKRTASFSAPTPPAPQEVEQARDAAARDVLAERQRQVSAEGWTPDGDDAYLNYELAHAAAAYAYPALTAVRGLSVWPWPAEWLKIRDHRRNVVKAAALLLAEIERLDRAAMSAQPDDRSQG